MTWASEVGVGRSSREHQVVGSGLTRAEGAGYCPALVEESDPKDGRDSTDGTGGGPRVSRMRVGGEDIVVLSVPLPKMAYPEGATAAEREIIDLVLEGLTAKQIAERRNAALRTVTTQLGRIFQKAGVNSQAELVAAMTGGTGDRTTLDRPLPDDADHTKEH